MSNLENLLDKILDEAKKEASLIKKEADKEKKLIVDSRIKEAEASKKRLLETALREAELTEERLVSRAELEARNEKLLAKQNIIEKTFDLAKDKLKSLDDEKYLKFFNDTINSLSLSGNEVFIVPDKYRAKVKKLGVKLSDEENVDSGFLIKDEGIILNYNFDSLVDYYREDLETLVAGELFKE